MSSLNVSHSVCVFCYRSDIISSKENISLQNVTNFVKYLGRFINYNKLFKHELVKSSQNLIKICAECVSLTDKFCEVYHHIKCLELDLEWNLAKLVKIVKMGGKVPSRVSTLNLILQEAFRDELGESADTKRTIQSFRSIVVKKGHKRLKKCQPRVLIKTIPNTCTSPEDSGANSTKENSNNYNHDIIVDNVVSCLKYERTANVSNYSEANDDDVEFSDLDTYQQETLLTPDNQFSNSNSDKLRNDDADDQVLDCLSDQMNTDNNDIPEEQDILPHDNTIMNNDHPENILEVIMSPQPLVDVDVNRKIYTTNSFELIENSNHAIVSNYHPINLKTELVDTPQASPAVSHNKNLDIEISGAEKTNKKLQLDIATDEIRSETYKTSATNTDVSPHQRYNFRDHRKSNIKPTAEFPSDLEDDDNEYCASPDSMTSDSSSDNGAIVANSTKIKRKGTPKRTFQCFLNACKSVFPDEKTYLNHKNLHSDGKFACSFCEIVETNLIKLSIHEYKIHLPEETKSEDLNHRLNFGRIWTCPRCSQACSGITAYQAHFSFAHFGVGEENKPFIFKRKLKSKMIKVQNRKKQELKNAKFAKTLKCNICQKIFSNLNDLLKHKRTYHNFKGSNLSKQESIEKELRSNIIADKETFKTLIANLKCNFCDLVFGNAHDLAVHETDHAVNTQVSQVKKFKCPRCPFMYNLLGVYLKHHLKSHLNISSKDLPGACTLCSGESVYILNSKLHYDRHHNLEYLESPNEAAKCNECSAYFLKDYQLLVHKTKVHLGNRHQCPFCDKVFRTRKFLLSHKKIVHKYHDEDPELPFGCDLNGCKKRYENKYELDFHKRFHKSIEVSQQRGKRNASKCMKCGLICKSKQALAQHKITSHPSTAVCQECGKSFKNKQVLETHLEYHKSPEEWKYECSECGKKCTDKHKLEEHKRTHTKEKPFVCQFCGDKYAHRHNWRNHLKVKHGDEEEAQKDIIGRPRNAKFMARKGSKKGDCIIAGKSTKKA